ncbi:unnamed protein product [Closterium sp. NIES-64]|nr:unnamed protein product [Closterium sp. NIES-64]
MIRSETNTSSSRGRGQDRAEKAVERGGEREGGGERETGGDLGEGGAKRRGGKRGGGGERRSKEERRCLCGAACLRAIGTASSEGPSAALDISSHPRCASINQAKMRFECWVTISRAAVHRFFRLPSATTDAISRIMVGAGWIAEAVGGSAGGGMGGGMVKQEGM